MDMNDEPGTPQPEAAPTFTRTDILAKLRSDAATLDPAHAFVYLSMSVDRWLAAADLACELLLAHARYQRHHPAGRRAHAARVHGLLDGANEAQLIAALVWTNQAFSLLPPPRPPGK